MKLTDWKSWLAFIAVYCTALYAAQAVDLKGFVRKGASDISFAYILVFCLILTISLLLPLSSSLAVLVAGDVAFGSTIAIVVGIFSGTLAAVTSYIVGRCFLANTAVGTRISAKLNKILSTNKKMWITIFILRAFPHPFYDLVGYASGISKIKFCIYLPASICGGSIAVFVVCLLNG